MAKDKRGADSDGPLVNLRPWARWAAAAFLTGIAAAHMVWPTAAIDAVTLGLLAFAAFVVLFDVESIEWQGIKARRREIARAKAALDEAPPTIVAAIPQAAPVLTKESIGVSDPGGQSRSWSATVHSTPADLNPPTERWARLMWGAEQIRIELIVLAGNSGRLPRVAPWSDYEPNELIEYLRPANLLSSELINAILTVFRMRNTAVHTQVVDPASDLAMDVLQKLRSIHRYYTRVRDPDVVVFRDQSLTTLHEFRGVMVVQIDEKGKVQPPMVYPRSNQYLKGRFVSWSWDMERATNQEAWYEDPSTGEVKHAWSSSATFVGREYPDQWGLQYRLPRPDLGLD